MRIVHDTDMKHKRPAARAGLGLGRCAPRQTGIAGPAAGEGVGAANRLRQGESWPQRDPQSESETQFRRWTGEPIPSEFAAAEDLQPIQRGHHAFGHDSRFEKSRRAAGPPAAIRARMPAKLRLLHP